MSCGVQVGHWPSQPPSHCSITFCEQILQCSMLRSYQRGMGLPSQKRPAFFKYDNVFWGNCQLLKKVIQKLPERRHPERVSALSGSVWVSKTHCTLNKIARLYFSMNKTLINLRSKKNMGPSPLTGLWVQWQCKDNEDFCHHNWDGSTKYSFITRKKYPLFNVSRANREGISQQIRSAWISAPTWDLDLDLSLTKTWKWKTGREYEIFLKKTRIWCIMLYTLWVSQRSSSVIWPLPWGT